MKLLKYILFFLCLTSISYAAPEKFVGCLYTITENNIKISWNPGQNVEYYEVQLVLIDRNILYPIITTTTNSITLPRPRAGHFKIRVRACNSYAKSIWIETVDSKNAIVDNQNMAWMIYWKLPAPGGIIVE